MKCPNCGAESNGAFCPECGAPVKGAQCRECAAPLVPGASFCTACGTPARAGARRANNTPWFVVGAALVAFIVVLMWPTISGRNGPSATEGRMPLGQMAGAADSGADASATGPTQAMIGGTPRENADRLFNRIMTERASGDTARAKFFLPMGIQAYQMVGDLDADGLYHLSLLQALSGDDKAALTSAERILKGDPKHLLGLAAAADAARASGATATAKKYYQRFLDAYDSELKTTKEEYKDHAQILPTFKKDAETFLK